MFFLIFIELISFRSVEPHITDGTIKIFMFKNPIQYEISYWANKNGYFV